MSISDDEVPEEIGLSMGKRQAEKLRSQEQAQQKQHSHTKRKKRRTNDSKIDAAGPANEATLAEGEADVDLVSDELIQALTAADRAVAEIKTSETAEDADNPAIQLKKRKRKRLLQHRAGPVTVQVLNHSQQSGAPSESAVLFAKKQLFCSKRRSIEMLRPCHKWSGKHSRTAHTDGPAMQFVKSKT